MEGGQPVIYRGEGGESSFWLQALTSAALPGPRGQGGGGEGRQRQRLGGGRVFNRWSRRVKEGVRAHGQGATKYLSPLQNAQWVGGGGR